MKHDSNRGFTLIELLTVIAIVALLASLVVAAANLARRKAALTRGAAEVRELAKAWKSYWQSYQEWPSGVEGQLVSMTPSVMDILQGSNPKELKFIDVSKNKTKDGYKDPWNTVYKVDFSRTISSGQFEYYQITVAFPNRNRYIERQLDPAPLAP